MTPAVTRYWRKRNRFFLFCPPIIVAILAVPVVRLEEWTSIPITNPVWDDRGGWGIIPALLLLGWFLGIFFFSRIHARLYWRQDISLYDRYQWRVHGYDHIRLDRCLGIFVTTPVLLGIMLIWHGGTAIGENGMVFKDGLWKVHQHSYDDAVSVARYNKFRAPMGIVDFANLEIRFKNGEKLQLRKQKGQRNAPALDATAVYIATRCGLPIARDDIPPRE